ncbi:hypothetical protein Nepgr_000244 [Nepenthes gracilis]|uniref:U-box domain-containing protein n=1 Tax=Nepenthes gracilis TaxID=150966 RepID=A0AAD3P470_NEPGR|nr:hypothetical protein Nepgr_000244 [Nepenthes gracilis]
MEEIEVPPHFLCPISLQLMRDPVTISTGITYDRESIERWLFSARKTTCPVTKQPISSADQLLIIPNHNLRRLIQSWCIVNASHGIERIPTPKPPVETADVFKLIDDATKSPNTQQKCLQILKSIASSSERNKKHLEACGAVIKFLASIIIKREDWTNVSEALSILHQLEAPDAALKALITQNDELLKSLLHVLRHGHAESRAFAITLLKNMYNAADPRQLMSAKLELFVEIVQVLRDQISHSASKAALKLLIELNARGRNRNMAAEAGAVVVLVELLLETAEKRNCELILNVLDQLCGCAEGRAALLEHAGGIAIVSKKILRVSNGASDRAVRILWSISKHSANDRVLGEMLEVGVVAKLCLVLHVDCSLKTKERAQEILSLHSRVWKNSPCIPAHLYSQSRR